jgi:type IV secretion system protein VirB10
VPPANPLRLTPPSGPVVRLNRRLLYVVGGVLVAVVVTGLIALRAQGSRDRGASASRVDTRPAAERWFDKVPDREPGPRVASLDPLPPTAPSPAPSPRPASAPPAPKTPTPEELEAQRRERAERAAMSAPIGIATFERGAADRAGARRAVGEAGDPAGPGKSGPAPREAVSATPGDRSASGAATTGDGRRLKAGLSSDYLQASVRAPVSPYEVKAGTIIPAVLLSAVNSDLPGQILGQVREAVYDTDTGEHLLIPQGTRLVGLYDHHVIYGQERVLITWKRLILPNGSSLSLRDGMPGTDAIGAAGFQDEVNNHYLRIFGHALLLSIISAGVQLSQIPSFGQDFQGPTAGNVLGAAVGQQLGSTAAELIRRGMTIAPTLEIRPGYPFNVMVTQDVVFPGPYDDARLP